MSKPTKWLCAQRRLRSAWAFAQSDQSLRCAHWVAKDPSFLHADSEDSDQTGRMPRLIWVSAGLTLTLLVLSRAAHINRDSIPRWNKMSTQQQDQHWSAGATEIQQLNQLYWMFYARAFIKSEDRLRGRWVQLKRAGKLLTMTGLTSQVCHLSHIYMLYPVLL